MIELIILTLATLLGTLLALEAKAWLPYLGGRLLTFAISRFPSELDELTRARWAKEIEADFHDFDDRPLGGFAFAFRVFTKGGRDLAAELALDEKISEGEDQQQASAEMNRPQSLSDFQLATLVRLLEPLMKPVGGATQDEAVTFLIARLAESFDEAVAEELRFQIADGLTHGAADYASKIDHEKITADDIRRFASRLRKCGGSEDE